MLALSFSDIWKRFEESKHRRHPKGDPRGGQFAPHGSFPSTGLIRDPILRIVGRVKRVFTGETVETKSKPSKAETGEITEHLFLSAYRSQNAALVRHVNNYPIDMVTNDGVYEIKGGLISNSRSAQQWRSTEGEISMSERLYRRARSDVERSRIKEIVQRAIIARKEAAVAALNKRTGRRLKMYTLAAIINPDTMTADLYRFSGFHARIGWTSPEAKRAYIGSVRYERTRR